MAVRTAAKGRRNRVRHKLPRILVHPGLPSVRHGPTAPPWPMRRARLLAITAAANAPRMTAVARSADEVTRVGAMTVAAFRRVMIANQPTPITATVPGAPLKAKN